MSKTVIFHAYPGSDTWADFSMTTTIPPNNTPEAVVWGSYESISLAVRESVTTKGTIGALTANVNSVSNPTLFQIVTVRLRINVSKIPGIVAFGKYECLLKVHDVSSPDGQILADYKENNDLPTMIIQAWPGGTA